MDGEDFGKWAKERNWVAADRHERPENVVRTLFLATRIPEPARATMHCVYKMLQSSQRTHTNSKAISSPILIPSCEIDFTVGCIRQITRYRINSS